MYISKLNFKISSLYNQRLAGDIGEDIYINKYSMLSNQRKGLTEMIGKSKNEIEKANLNTLQQKKQIFKEIEQIEKKDFNNLNIKELIDRIEIHKNEINIYFKFAEVGKFRV